MKFMQFQYFQSPLNQRGNLPAEGAELRTVPVPPVAEQAALAAVRTTAFTLEHSVDMYSGVTRLRHED